jgi:hypothetical protein
LNLGFWDPKGKTPQNTVSSTLSEFIKNSTAILRISPGTYKFNDEIANLDIEIKKKKPKKPVKTKTRKNKRKTENYSDEDENKLKRKRNDETPKSKIATKKQKISNNSDEEEDSNDSQDKNDSEYEDKKKYKPKNKKNKKKKKKTNSLEEEEETYEDEEEVEEEEEVVEENAEKKLQIIDNDEVKKELKEDVEIKKESEEIKKEETSQNSNETTEKKTEEEEEKQKKKDFNDYLKTKFNEMYNKFKVIKHDTCQICYKKCSNDATQKCNYMEEGKNKKCDEIYHKECLKSIRFDYNENDNNFVCVKHFCNLCNQNSIDSCYFCTYSRCKEHKEENLLTYDSKVLCKNCEEGINGSQSSSILNKFK